MAKLDIIAHRGHWAGIKSDQNKLEAIFKAKKANFSVELDLRLSDSGHIHLAHDEIDYKSQYFGQIVQVMGGRLPKTFFHIKDNASKMLPELIHLTDKIKTDYYFFGLNEEEKEEYAEVFGWERICYELETGVTGTVEEALKSKSDIIWLGFNEGALDYNDLDELLESSKKIYWCSQELFGNYFTLLPEVKKEFAGICTDLPVYYKYKYATT